MTPRSEAELCDALAVAAAADGWDVYPEVEGWDLLLVWNGTREDPLRLPKYAPPPVGYQIGIEAKLRGSCEAIVEALDRSRYKRPDEIAVLVPKAGKAFRALCAELRVRVFAAEHYGPTPASWGMRDRKTVNPLGATAEDLERAAPLRLKVPEVALQGSGGHASPRTMSTWRVSALRLCILLRSRGYLTGQDFKDASVSRQRWLTGKWIVRDGSEGRHARYVSGPRLDVDGPEVGYEAERDALAARDGGAAE